MSYGEYDGNYRGGFGRASDIRGGGSRPSFSALANEPASTAPSGAPGEGLSGWDRAVAIQNAGTNMRPAARAEGFQWIFTGKFDAADHLPPAAAAKLVALREMLFTMRSLSEPLFDRTHEARIDLMKARAELAEMERKYEQRMDRRAVESNPARDAFEMAVAEHRAKVARLQSEHDRVLAIQNTAAARSSQVGALLDNSIERYLKDRVGSGATFIELEVPTAKPRKGESITDAIGRVRAEIATTKADIEATAAAPITAATAKAKARAEIERLADEGRPSIVNLRLHGEQVAWPKTGVNARVWADAGDVRVTGVARDLIPTGHSLVAWLFRDQLIAAIDREIDGFAAGPGFTDDQRAARTFELTASLFALECEEEGLIEQAAAQGTEILRRVDADPAAVLGIAVQ